MSIQETRIKIKGLPETIGKYLKNPKNRALFEGITKKLLFLMAFLLILGGAFLGGRISALAPKNRTIQIEYPPLIKNDIPLYQEPASSSSASADDPDNSNEAKSAPDISPPKTVKTDSSEPKEWNFAASKTGKAYYPKGCKSLSRIKPENRVYFMTSAEAETSGLALAKGCNNQH